MTDVHCKTQAELDAALEAGDLPILTGDGEFDVRGSATVRAWGSATVRAWGSATVHATKQVAVQDHGPDTTIEGGVLISIRHATTVKQWCDFHGVPITGKGPARQVVLFKAVREDYRSSHGGAYTPGTVPEAPDWDGGKMECGGGLHFSPRAWLAEEFDSQATRFVGMPVLVKDIRPPRAGDEPATEGEGAGRLRAGVRVRCRRGAGRLGRGDEGAVVSVARIYLAAAYPRKDLLRGFRDELETLGYLVSSRWVSAYEDAAEADLTDEQRAAEAASDVADLMGSQIVAVFCERRDSPYATNTGHHFEAGFAYALGKQVAIIGEPRNVFAFAPRVRRFPRFREFREALPELVARIGERAA